jgi:hypothetical protein
MPIRDIVDPARVNCRTLRDDPKFENCNVLTPYPRDVRIRILKFEPKTERFKTDETRLTFDNLVDIRLRPDPRRVCCRSENVEELPRKLHKLKNFPPTILVTLSEMLDARLNMSWIETFITLPNILQAPKSEHFEPIFNVARTEIVDDKTANLSMDTDVPNRPTFLKDTEEPSVAHWHKLSGLE